MRFGMTNGNGSRVLCRVEPKAGAVLARTIGCFSTRFCGWRRSGARWRDLPERLGDYRSVKRRYYRWIEMRVLNEMLSVLARKADVEWLMIDDEYSWNYRMTGSSSFGKCA